MSFYIKFILSLIILVTPPTLVFAQTPSPSPQPAVFEDLLRQIQELFAQIQRIEQQIINLRGTPVTAPAAEPVQPATPTFQGLKRGDRGPTVNDLQKFLIDEGYLLIRLPTGFFGPLTEAAMRRFQDENGLPTTGRLDTETRTVVETRRGLTFVIPGLIQEGTGASGQIPPGLLIAPGIQGQLLSTGTPPFGTGTPPYGTGTPPFGTGTPGALPSPSPSVSQCSNYGGAGQCLSNPYCAWMNNSCVPASSIGPCLSWMTIPIVLEGGCHSMGNAYFNGPMTKYLSANASEGSWPTLCSQAWIPNCTVPGPGFTPSPLPSPIPSATSTPPTPTPSSGNGTSTPPTTPAPPPSPTPPSSSTAPITVTSPNGESIWDVYHYNQGIYWILNGVSRVGFKLLKGSQVVYSNSSPITSNNTTLSIPPTLDGIPTAYYNSIGGGSDYKIRVFDWDNPGVYDDSDNYFTIPLPDITPPVVSSVSASSITSNSAVITWTTDEPATGFVNYGGGTPPNWIVSPTITSYSTSHSFILSNLESNTLYTYRVYSVDAVSNGPQGYPPSYTFTTASPNNPPVITSGPNATPASIPPAPAIYLEFATNVACSSTFYYGTTTSYGGASLASYTSSTQTSHGLHISALIPNTTYHFKVSCANSGGTVESNDITFNTGSAFLPGAPATRIAMSELETFRNNLASILDALLTLLLNIQKLLH